MASGRLAGILLGTLCVIGCDRAPERVGANKQTELRTARAVPGNDLVVPGCCSFASSGIAFERESSDSYLLHGKARDADLSIAFGPFESPDLPGAESSGRIDEINVRNLSRPYSGGTIEKVWVATVPPSPEGADRRLRPYVLRINARCSTERSCREVDKFIETLRF